MGLFAIAPDKEYGHYAAIRKVKKDFGGTRGEIVFIACLLARSRRRPIGLAILT